MNIHTAFDLIAWGSGAVIGFAVRRRTLAAGTPSGFRISQHPGYIIAVALCTGLGALLAGGGNMALAGMLPLGHSIAGAIAGGIVGAEGYKLARGIKGSTGLVFVAPLAAGIAIGRWGCFLSGLPDYTYGIPTGLPWGVDFGDGIPRHPVQLYESFAMLGFLIWFVWQLSRRASLVLRSGFHLLVAYYAVQRFCWEFLKPYPKVLGPFDMFHFLMLALFAYSLWMLWGERRRHEQAGHAKTLSA
ncbi:prolipoprotein diacylglyceryl transferase [Dongia sedimenti]|uniref:Prolipoprotein diacylglyceryl transferase n=1 Tax=Dongia sedimenti TaxID=3064282 RepID=A0ABU0YP55_9PROT|nr:prolipoprotein diacylglyceryl transferase [Rhodospirillaceae bacterium R-7]